MSTIACDVVEAVQDRREVRQDQVDAGLVHVGEQHAAVDDQQLAVVLEDGHVAADLAEAAQRDDPQGRPRAAAAGEFGLRMTLLRQLASPGELAALTPAVDVCRSCAICCVGGVDQGRADRSGRAGPSRASAALTRIDALGAEDRR